MDVSQMKDRGQTFVDLGLYVLSMVHCLLYQKLPLIVAFNVVSDSDMIPYRCCNVLL